MALRRSKQESKTRFQNIKVACVEKVIQLLIRRIEVAVGAALEQESREGEDGKDQASVSG